jgi:hypothetical protein
VVRGDEAGAGGRSRRTRDLWPVVAIALGFVVIGLIFREATTGLHPKTAPVVPRTQPLRDARDADDGFERTRTRGLGRSETGQPWRSVRGVWGIRDGQARLLDPAPAGPSLALVTVGIGIRSVEVRAAAIARGMGLAFRCQGVANCWRVEAVPSFGTWNVVKVVGGDEQVMGNLGTVAVDAGTVIGVEQEGRRLRFTVNGELVRTIVDGALRDAPRAGLSMRAGGSARSAAWDDFVARADARVAAP